MRVQKGSESGAAKIEMEAEASSAVCAVPCRAVCVITRMHVKS